MDNFSKKIFSTIPVLLLMGLFFGLPFSSTLHAKNSQISPLNNYPITPYVVGPVGQAGYQTVQSAINAANNVGGGTVYIQPGIYVENLKLFEGVDLWGAVGVADTQTCKIIGAHTPPLKGALTIRNIFLQNDNHIFSSAEEGSSKIILIDVAVGLADGYTFNLPKWSGALVGFDIGEIGSINDGWINNTGGATVFLTNITMGKGSKNTMITSGPVEIYNCIVQCPVDFQKDSKGVIDGGTLFQQSVIFSDTSSFKISNSTFQGINDSPITYNSSANSSIATSLIRSPSHLAINGKGSGALTICGVSFIGNSNIAKTLNLLAGTIRGGNFISQYVVGKAPDAQYQTIQSAINAANKAGGGTIYIYPDEYIENLILFDKIQLLGAVAEEEEGNIQITGTHTLPLAGSVVFRNLQLNSANHIFDSEAKGNSTVSLVECTFNVQDGFIFNLPNWTGNLRINDANAIGLNDGIVNNQAGATLFFNNANLGAGTGRTMIVSGDARLDLIALNCPSNFSKGNLYLNIGFSTQPTTFSGTVNPSVCLWDFRTGSQPAIIQNSQNLLTLKVCSIDSTANPVITGNGKIKFSGVNFVDSAFISKTIEKAFSTLFQTDDIKIGKAGISIEEGADTRMGSAKLINGTITVSTRKVTLNSRIFLTSQEDEGTPGFLRVTSRIPGKSFTITSSSSQDASLVGWVIFEPFN